MKAKGWLLIGGAGALAYWLMRQKNTVDQLSYFIAGVKYDKSNSNILRTQLLLTLRINNPTTNTVSFDGFSGLVTTSGQRLASISMNRQFDGINIVPGNNDITMPVIINHIGTITTVVSLLTALANGTSQPFNIEVNGSLLAGGVELPVKQAVTVNLGAISGCGPCGIGRASAKLDFATNTDLQAFFCNAGKVPAFSVNGVPNAIPARFRKIKQGTFRRNGNLVKTKNLASPLNGYNYSI